MGTPTLTLIGYTSISTAESTTGWTKYDTLDPDIVKEGSNGITGTFRTDGTVGYFDNGSAPITAVGKTFRKWINTTNVAYMDTLANGGYELSIYDGTTTEYKTMFSSDDYYGGWFNVVFDMDAFTTLTLANVQRWGLRIQHHASAKNIDNVWTDAYKYMDGYSMTGGTSGDEITLSDIEIADRGTTTLYGYGIITEFGGVYYSTGEVQLGTGATTTYFEMDGDILVFEDKPIAAGLYSLAGVGTGTTVTIQNNSTIISAGTTDATRYLFDWNDADLSSFTCKDSLIVRASTISFKSGQTVTGNTFNDCGQITHGGATTTGCTVKNYEGTADTAALIYNIATDPNGEMDEMVFIKGTASTHAIEFGSTSPTTMTLTDIDFSGYNAADAQTDSALYFSSTGTQDYVVNLVGCTGNIKYKAHASFTGTVTLVLNPVALTITVKNTAGTEIENARVLVEIADNLNFTNAYQKSVSIARTTTTATVTHTAHGLSTGDYVVIKNCTTVPHLNGSRQITVTTVNAYTYTCQDSGGASDTGGNATLAIISELTNASGVATESRTYGVNQLITGRVRKSTGTPAYITAPISGEIDKDTGLSIAIQMILD